MLTVKVAEFHSGRIRIRIRISACHCWLLYLTVLP